MNTYKQFDTKNKSQTRHICISVCTLYRECCVKKLKGFNPEMSPWGTVSDIKNEL